MRNDEQKRSSGSPLLISHSSREMGTPTVALVGNPNTGKTTLFNALAGMNQRVGNYPGVTVETKKGKLRFGDLAIDVIDLPGTYSLAPRSPARWRGHDFRCVESRTQSLLDDAGAGTRRPRDRRPQYDGRGRGAGAQD